MNIFDYLNSKRGSQLLAIYAAIAVIGVLLLLLCVVVIRDDLKDIPANFAFLLGGVVAAAFGTHLADKKINPVTDDTTQGAPPPPPQPPAG